MGAQYVQPLLVAKTFRDVEGAHHIREEETEHEWGGPRWLCLPRHLVETPALRETLEMDPAPVHKLNVLVGADDAAHDLGDQDLVAGRLRFNALSGVYRRSKQIFPFHDGLAGVDPYPYMDLPVRMAAVLLSQCP